MKTKAKQHTAGTTPTGHINKWARVAYIIATIVTVFAQLGAAVPAVMTAADVVYMPMDNGVVLADKNGYKVGDTVELTVTPGTGGTTRDELQYDTSKLAYDDTMTQQKIAGAASVGESFGSDNLAVISTSASATFHIYFKVTGDLSDGAAVQLLDDKSKLLGSAQLNAPGAMNTQQVLDTYNKITETPDTVVSGTGAIKMQTPKVMGPTGSGASISYQINVTIGGTEAMSASATDSGSTQHSFVFSWKGLGLTPIQSQNHFEEVMADKGFTVDWSKVDEEQVTITATKAIAAPWAVVIPFAITKETQATDFTIETPGGTTVTTVHVPGTDDPDTTEPTTTDPTTTEPTTTDPTTTTPTDTTEADADGLRLDPYNKPKDPYPLGSDITLLLTANLDGYPGADYRDVEVGITGDALGDNVEFDGNGMTKVMTDQGFTAKTPVKNKLYTAYEFTNGDGYFRIWAFADNSIRVEWDKGTTGMKSAFIVLKARRTTITSKTGDSDAVTLKPQYLGSKADGDKPTVLGTGVGADIQIAKPDGFEGSEYHFDARSITKDNPDTPSPEIYHLAAFPLFYLNDPANADLYSFVQNYNAGTQYTDGFGSPRAITEYRSAVKNGKAYPKSGDGVFGGAASTGALGAEFEDFAKVNADGTQDTTTLAGLQAGVTYKLNPIHPVAGTTDRFYRINTRFSVHYYMPDGIPTFSLDDTGNIKLTPNTGDGKAKKGQWTASGKTITTSLYKIKYIQVVDQDGQPVDGAKIQLKNTDSTKESMHATTSSYKAQDLKGNDNVPFSGTGELLPDDYKTSDAGDGPFYYVDGDQTLDKLTLPAGYSDEGVAFTLGLDSATDKLAPTNMKNATLSDDGQTLILSVHKLVGADTDLNIQKIAQDTKAALAGASFKVEEVGNTTDALTTATKAVDDNGQLKLTVDADSATTTRTVHVTEDAHPAGYGTSAAAGYYATWVKGQGFTAVSETQGSKDTTSADGLASVKGGVLTIGDPPLVNQGGGDTGIKFQYVDAADYKSATATGIAGATLPAVAENKTYTTGVTPDFSGLGGVVYNKTAVSDPTTLMHADSGLATTTLAHDSSMAGVQVSDAQGYGEFQQLWSQNGVTYGWDAWAQTSAGWLLSNAIVNGTIPSAMEVDYQLNTPAQRQRQSGAAHDYYNLGGNIGVSYDGTTVTAKDAADANKTNTHDRDNSLNVVGNTVQVELYKVKHVSVIDTAGHPVSDAVVSLTGMTGTTGADGTGELLPNAADGTPTTAGDNFVFPDGTQTVKSVATTSGTALETGAVGEGVVMGSKGVDQLRLTGTGSDTQVIDNGQTIQITVKAPTTIKIHKQDLVNPDKPVAGVTFTVAAAGDASDTVTTAATDANGDTTATLAKPDANKQYTITEASLPNGSLYQKDPATHTFSWNPTDGVTAVGADDDRVAVGTGGTLVFSDLKGAGGGGVGENGTNGGQLTITKSAVDDPAAKLDDAAFTLTEKGGPSFNGVTAGGQLQFDLGEATATTRAFTLHEDTAPAGYMPNTADYTLTIAADGTMQIDGAAASQDKKVAVTDFIVNVADDVQAFNGGKITIKKIDAATKAGLGGATITLTDAKSMQTYGTTNLTGKDGTTSIDVGDAAGQDRLFALYERTAPMGYTALSDTYDVLYTKAGELKVADTSGKVIGDGSTSVDGKVTIANNVITVADTAQPQSATLQVHKTDAATRKQSLAGATFNFMEMKINADNSIAADPTTSGATIGSPVDAQTLATGLTAAFTTGTSAAAQHVVAFREGANPDGYVLNNHWYFATISHDQVLGVSQDPEISTAEHTADGVVTVNAGTHTVEFADEAEAAGSLTVKKTAIGSTTGLSGAIFTIAQLQSATNTTPVASYKDLTTGTDGTLNKTLGSLKDGVFSITETKAPDGYTTDANTYYFKWTAAAGVTGVGKSASALTTTSVIDSNNQTILAAGKDGTLVFSDAVKPTTTTGVKIQKVDMNTPATKLAGATFKLQDVSLADDGSGAVYTSDATAADGTVTIPVSETPSSLSVRIFKLTETKAPDGYALNNTAYYFTWDKTGNALKVGSTRQNALNANAANASADGVVTVGSPLTFADAKPVAPKLTLHKTVTASSAVVGGATYSVKEIDSSGNPKSGGFSSSATTTATGDATVTFPSVAQGTSTVYQLRETTAPVGYQKDSNVYFVRMVAGKGITAVATSFANLSKNTLAAGNATANGSALNVTDAPLTYKLSVMSRIGTDKQTMPKIAGVHVTLSGTGTANGTPLTADTDGNGEVSFTALQLAALNGNTTDATKSSDIHVDVDSADAGFTNPLPRNVQFSINGGLVAYTTTTDTVKGYDGMLESQVKSGTTTPSGSLNVYVRKDTLHAESLTKDAEGNAVDLIGATFQFTFKDLDGNVLGTSQKPLTIPDSGVLLLPDPDSIVGKNVIPIGQQVKVEVKQLTSMDGYTPVPDAYTFDYASGSGYSHMSDFWPSIDAEALDPVTGEPYNPDAAQPVNSLHWDNSGRTMSNPAGATQPVTVAADLFTFGGSQLSFYNEEAPSLKVDNLPDTLNFGKPELKDTAQDVVALASTAPDEQLAKYKQEDTRTSADVGVSLTQKGTYANGWALSLKLGALIPEDGSANLDDDHLTFHNSTRQFNGADAPAPNSSVETIQANENITTSIMAFYHSTDPGQYTIAWQPDDISLSAPGGGLANVGYRADLTWVLTMGQP